jgi:hypothetical protein
MVVPAANAAELDRVGLVDALAILELIEELEPERFEAAAVRWAGRLALEAKGLVLVELGHAVRALDALPDPAARRLLLAFADPRRHGSPASLLSPARRGADAPRAGARLDIRSSSPRKRAARRRAARRLADHGSPHGFTWRFAAVPSEVAVAHLSLEGAVGTVPPASAVGAMRAGS